MSRRNLFDVDANGLKKLIAKRGISFALFELWQNVRDTSATWCNISFSHTGIGRQYRLQVEDDNPNGFSDLTHAYTLFAESEKKGDPSKGGMFNLGEKLVIAVCKEATILTTSGGVRFDEDGRHMLRKRRDKGSIFDGILILTDEEYQEACDQFMTVIVPKGIKLTFNNQEIEPRIPEIEFEMKLTTPISDEEGVISLRERNTLVGIYIPREGETPTLYEHGIPVLPNSSNWHYLVHQKTPVPFNRDNVPPAYLKKLHVECVNHMHVHLNAEDVNKPFVQAAISDKNAVAEAVQSYKTHKYGDKVVVFDPSDAQANNRAVAEGYTLIYGRSEEKGVFEHFRNNNIAQPAGKLFPTPKAYDPNSTEFAMLLTGDEITIGMQQTEALWKALANKLMGVNLTVRFIEEGGANACYIRGKNTSEVHFFVKNVKRSYGRDFFDKGIHEKMLDLMLDEFGHQYESNHLSENYYRSLRTLGAKLTMLAINEPEFYKDYLDIAK